MHRSSREFGETVARPIEEGARLVCHLLLIDDHPLFRAGLRLVLEDCMGPDFSISEAGSMVEALAVAHARIDVLLLDVLMPGMNGIDGIRLLQGRWPNARIIMLSAVERADLASQAIERGAVAFLSKTAAPEVISATVLRALRGEFPESLAAPTLRGAEHISPRQLEVLELMCQGLSNKAIASRLAVSENTARNQGVAILRYFSVSTRTEAVMRAQRLGLTVR